MSTGPVFLAGVGFGIAMVLLVLAVFAMLALNENRAADRRYKNVPEWYGE